MTVAEVWRKIVYDATKLVLRTVDDRTDRASKRRVNDRGRNWFSETERERERQREHIALSTTTKKNRPPDSAVALQSDR